MQQLTIKLNDDTSIIVMCSSNNTYLIYDSVPVELSIKMSNAQANELAQHLLGVHKKINEENSNEEE